MSNVREWHWENKNLPLENVCFEKNVAQKLSWMRTVGTGEKQGFDIRNSNNDYIVI